ncbi:MAG TPA: transglycosylase domain-containing protein [Actinomycetota bacterium]|nr:transglycosylase domain-containing protein [Actinomycetota bacterium]
MPRVGGGRARGTRGRGAALVAALALVASACSLRPVDLDAERPLALRSTITASDGTVLARLYRENRSLASLRRMPQTVVDAVLAAEDARFFDHPGFDGRAIVRAALRNLHEGEVVEGGSTITQQYVKNTFFRRPSRTIERKLRELRLALEVERRYPKREILERYLNTVYFGEGAYGVKAAAEVYFGHGYRTLSLPEAALLAALVKAPALYDPRDHPRRARLRRDYVLGRMAELRLVSRAAAAAARRAPLGVVRRPPRVATRQPYFVEAVKREVLGDERLGPTEADRARALWRGGLRVTTTLDPRAQRAAERAVAATLGRRDDPAAALVALRPRTGEIVAMVGGRDWSASQVNLALGAAGGGSGRQAGSSFKPIVAATALESGIGLDTTYDAGPLTVTLGDGHTWPVTSSVEGAATGRMRVDEALVASVNPVFARLALELGVDRIATQARLMGVRARLPRVPALALGAGDVSVLDMATAYATIANGGTAIEPTTLRRVEIPGVGVVTPEQERVDVAMSPGNAYLLTQALIEVIERGTGAAAAIGRPAAGKTGTTNDYADAWFVGYTPQLVAAVWVGYPEGRIPMTSVRGISVAGGTFPAQIWRRFMLAALDGEPVRDFEVPRSELVRVEIDPDTGLLAAPWCPGRTRVMLRQLVPLERCPEPPPPEPTPVPTPTPSPTPSDEPSPRPSERPSPDATPSPSPDDDARGDGNDHGDADGADGGGRD